MSPSGAPNNPSRYQPPLLSRLVKAMPEGYRIRQDSMGNLYVRKIDREGDIFVLAVVTARKWRNPCWTIRSKIKWWEKKEKIESNWKVRQ